MPFQESIEKLLSEVLLHCIMLSVVFFVALLWASTEVNEQHFNHNGFVLIGQTFVQRQAFIDGRTTGLRFRGRRRPTVNNATETNESEDDGNDEDGDDDTSEDSGATGNGAAKNANNNDDDDTKGGSGATGNGTTETNGLNQNLNNNLSEANVDSKATENDATETNKNKSEIAGGSIKIKLVFTDESIRLVSAKLFEKIIDFKRKHFVSEIAANKMIRLEFDGCVLMNETTVRSNGLYNNCSVQCQILDRPQYLSNPQHISIIVNCMGVPTIRRTGPPVNMSLAELYQQFPFSILSVLKIAFMSTAVYLSVIYFIKPTEPLIMSLINSLTLAFYVFMFAPMAVWISNNDHFRLWNNNNNRHTA